MTRRIPLPKAADAREAWETGRGDGSANKPLRPDAYTDKTLQLIYQRGFHRAVQQALQAKYGPPPVAPTSEGL